MRGELDLFGIYVPPLMLLATLAWLIAAVLARLLNRAGFYRAVWHRPLFNVALYVLVLGAVVFGLRAVLDAA